MKKIGFIAVLAAAGALTIWSASRPAEVKFEKILIDDGASETTAFADINGDGKLDIVSGECWYEAPKWTPHKFREIPYSPGYIDNFADLPLDVNGDGRVDIISAYGFQKKLVWMENPGKAKGPWKEHVVDQGFFIEFAFLVDLNNDGKAEEILPQYGGASSPLAWYEHKDGGFVKHVISQKGHGHGIGVGDVNGDGRNDVLVNDGWFEAPADPREGEWKWHPDFKLDRPGFIYTLDINGDGRPDIVTTAGHDYGIYWLEQMPDGKWSKHMIDDTVSQPHSMVLVDVNGDGQKDLLTGKRYMAHDHDPGAREPLGIYWYEYRKAENGKIIWVKHVIDYSTRAGGGIEIATADLDHKNRIDFAAGGKTGLYLFRNLGAESRKIE
jgi:hypothetical protein